MVCPEDQPEKSSGNFIGQAPAAMVGAVLLFSQYHILLPFGSTRFGGCYLAVAMEQVFLKKICHFRMISRGTKFAVLEKRHHQRTAGY